MNTVTFERTLKKTFEVQTCITCGCEWAMSVDLTDQRRKDARTFYCPNGHGQSYTESEADRIKREAEKKITRLQESLRWAQDGERANREWAQRAENSLRATRGVVTRLKNRAKNGVCPCCHRTFSQLARHMANKHPDFALNAATEQEARDV